MKKILIAVLQPDGFLRYGALECPDMEDIDVKLAAGEILVAQIDTEYSIELAKILHEINIKRYQYKRQKYGNDQKSSY